MHCAEMLLHLLLLHLSLLSLLVVPLLVAADQGDGSRAPCRGTTGERRLLSLIGEDSCPETILDLERDLSQCFVCKDRAACTRKTGNLKAMCYKGVEVSSLAQAKAYHCNFEAPQELMDAVQPGAFIKCDIGSAVNTSHAAGDGHLGASCTFSLVAAGDHIECKAAQCTARPNSTVLQCEASSCRCSLTKSCTSEFATNLVESLSGVLSWGCEVPPGGLTSLSNPANCTWKAAGLPGGSAQAVCDVGECRVPGWRWECVQKLPDIDALMELRRSFTNGEEVLAEWSPSGNPCDWEAVRCLSNQVHQLLLGDKGLKGKLPPSDTFPNCLVRLELNDNSLSGSIPADWKLLEGLEVLTLAGNRLTGSIPATWSLPSSLTAIDLSSNQLNGSLSVAWQLPGHMTFFSASGNQLSGSIPAGWVLPSSLIRLSLGGNKLKGEAVPEGMKLPDSLEWYEVDVNELGGNFEEMASRLPKKLGHLGLNNNSITGTIPPEWNLPTTMLRLSLSNNLLSGSIPSTWNPPSSLSGLYLFNNRLNGNLPSWPALADLNATVAPNPGLCGTVPPVPKYNAWDANLSSDFQRDLASGSFRINGIAVGRVALMDYMDHINVTTPLRSLPACAAGNNNAPNGSATDVGSLRDNSAGVQNVAAIAGGVAGGCMVLVVACGILIWRRACPLFGGGTGSLSGDQALNLERQPPETRRPEKSTIEASGKGRLGQGLKEWEINFNEIQLVKQICQGSCGRVYMALWRETRVAVKILLDTALDICNSDMHRQALTLSNPMLTNLHKEAGLMASLRHPNIVGFLGVCHSPPAVVVEFCSRGSLRDILSAAKRTASIAAKLTWRRKLRMLHDTARGMLYLHERQPPVIHRDLKSPNLLVDESWRVRVADFNVSKIMEGAVDDVYACGLVMWELLTHKLPFEGENHFQLIKLITSGGRPPIPEPTKLPGSEAGGQFDGLDDYIALMQRCWAQTPEERPSFQEMVQLVRDIMVLASHQVQPTTEEG